MEKEEGTVCAWNGDRWSKSFFFHDAAGGGEIDASEITLQSKIVGGTVRSVYKGLFAGQEVTVKVLDCGITGGMTLQDMVRLRKIYEQEVSIRCMLDHPNITKFVGAAADTSKLKISNHNGGIEKFMNNCCIIVTEYLSADTLKSYLVANRKNKLSFKIFIQLALDLAEGLSYLHSKNIVHRDVNTENLLLDQKLTLKIANFGVACTETLDGVQMGGLIGTLGYMAPEVLNGKQYNRKCDVYSFGVCLWEMYCCDMPLPEITNVTSALAHQNIRPKVPRCCPSTLAKVMKRCWDAEPFRRPEMEEVVAMLEVVARCKGGGMRPDRGNGLGCLMTNSNCRTLGQRFQMLPKLATKRDEAVGCKAKAK